MLKTAVAVLLQAAAPRRAAGGRRWVAEEFPAESQDVLHIEVFPPRARHAWSLEGKGSSAGAGVDGPAGGGDQRSLGLEKEAGCALCTPGADGEGRMRALPGDNRSADGRAARLSCGQVAGLERGEPTGWEQRRSGMPRVDNPRSPCRCPVITEGGTTGVLKMHQGGSARSKAPEAAVDGYTSLGCARGTASVGKVWALLSLQLSSVPGERRERERERERAPSR